LKPPRGFGLVELMVTIAIIGLLLVATLPSVGNSISNSRSRQVVSKFVQDFNALRAMASTGNHKATSGVVLSLASNCTWTATVDGSTNTNYSITATELASKASGLSCATTTPAAFPITFTFDSFGHVSIAATFSFSTSSGQNWPIQVFQSGTLLFGQGAS
jgi:prepilin-type N-terminal cleavage/methylation domain-containing protein